VKEADSKLSGAQLSKTFGIILNPRLGDFTGIPLKRESTALEPKENARNLKTTERSLTNQSSKSAALSDSKQVSETASKPPVRGIAAAFQKSKKPPKEPQERVIMEDDHNSKDVDDDELDDELFKKQSEDRKKAHEKLEKMFDDEETVITPMKDTSTDILMEDVAELPQNEIREESPEPAKSAIAEPTEVLEAAPPGRRRGRRKVQKKVTKTDKKGYLITTMEDVWEEFSEDESESQPRAQAKPLPAFNQTSSKPKGKQQSSLFSFFKK
jgi:hypothetical protein